jgi:hypothetical protein
MHVKVAVLKKVGILQFSISVFCSFADFGILQFCSFRFRYFAVLQFSISVFCSFSEVVQAITEGVQAITKECRQLPK